MKNLILTLAICLLSIVAFAQTPAKQDTTVQITLSLAQFRALLGAIDASVDSKRTSKELIDFIQANTKIVQPADKPKK